MRYDLIVVGNTPAGRAGALAAALADKSVALVEQPMTDSHCADGQGGPVPAGVLRQILADLSSFRYRALWNSPLDGREAAMQHLRQRVAEAVGHERNVARDSLAQSGISVYRGGVRFSDTNCLDVDDLLAPTRLTASCILIATGTSLVQPSYIPFDGERMIAAGEIPTLPRLPRSLVLMGADSVGVEYGLMLAMLGVQVTVVENLGETRTFRDAGLAGLALSMAASPQFTLTSGVEIAWIDRLDDGRVGVRMETGERIVAEVAAHNQGRRGNTDGLHLSAAGLVPDERGRLWCNDNLQTWQPHIYACGDIVGYPQLDEKPHEQAERAVDHALRRQVPQRIRVDESESTVSLKPSGSGAPQRIGSLVRG